MGEGCLGCYKWEAKDERIQRTRRKPVKKKRHDDDRARGMAMEGREQKLKTQESSVEESAQLRKWTMWRVLPIVPYLKITFVLIS